jgi:hypothetical protein
MNARTFLLPAALALGIACGSKPPANLSLSANASAQVTAPATPSVSTPAGTVALDLGNGIALTEVRIVIRKLKVATGTATPSTSRVVPGSDGVTDLEKEAGGDPELGPVLVFLKGATLAGGIRVVFDGQVPQGDFRALKLAIGPVTAAQAGKDQTFADAPTQGGSAVDPSQGLAAMAAQDASIVVDGVIAGPTGTTSFEFVSSLTAEIEQACDLSVSESKPNNLTLALDPTGWFGGAGIARLNPSDPGSKAGIEANILSSIGAFEDDNKSGHRHVGP